MARITKRSESPSARLSEDIYGASPEPGRSLYPSSRNGPSSLSSPGISNSSDKENASSRSALEKGKGPAAIPPPKMPTPLADTERSGKRKRVDDSVNAASRDQQRRRTIEPGENLDLEEDEDEDENGDSDSYDPDQSVEVRRQLRKNLRDLGRDLNDNRAEYMHPDSMGLLDTLNKANQITSSIKQTSDATIDSRLLVSTADLSYRKVQQLTLGGNYLQGVDVDELVSKAITFMRQADSPGSGSSSQRRRRRDEAPDDVDDEDGDMLNWEYLGRNICLQHNVRPSMPGFLLGPLSLEKRARKPIQRRGNLKKSAVKETRPEILEPGDIEKVENSNLTILCTRILARLGKMERDGQEAVEREHREDMTDAEVIALMDKYGVHESGGVDLLKFVVNPYSFGQTVENLFYVSFLLRDGKAGIIVGNDGLPSLQSTEPRQRAEVGAKGVSKHQAILSIDMETWKNAIEVFEMREPMIPHRVDEPQTQPGVRGWYS